MAENHKAVSIRFNMDDRADRELYLKLAEKSGSTASLTAYVKRVLEEYFSLDIKIADRQEFHSQMLAAIREEMQSQGMKLVGALLAIEILLAGIGTVSVPIQLRNVVPGEAGLPEASEELPEGLKGILDLIG